MKLSEICIRRPVLSIVMTLLIVIVGAVSYTYLQLRQFPQVERPIISVTTTYEGASPQIVESRITKPLESALAGIEGVEFITSVSESENSRINLNFKPDRDIDAAASDVREKIGRVRMRLPEGARDSFIKKSDADAAAIIYLALSSENPNISTAELYDYAHHYLENEFESIGGVAAIELFGSNGHVVHIWLDPIKMAAYNVTTHEVSAALRQQNVHIPAGRLVGQSREMMVTTAANLKSIQEFKNVIIHREKDFLVKLEDVARVEFSPAEERSLARFNGKPAISIGLVKKSIANPLQIAKDLKELLPTVKRNLPKDFKIDIAYDKTIFIDQSLKEVYKTFFEAAGFVFIIILIFLWSFRASLIPVITIPICVIATFTLLYMFGFSLNTLTLLAIVLAIGLVVDDAIVMMENIYRYMEEEGLSPLEAAFKGSKEISFAIIAMTLTLAAVYAPIALSQGVIGKMFTEFALTLAGSVLISGFVALTLSPMMCAYLLKPHTHVTGDSPREKLQKLLQKNRFEPYYQKIEKGYGALLRKLMSIKGMVLSVAIIFSVVGGIIGLKFLPSELTPQEDQGLINAGAMIPQGATLPYISQYVKEMEKILMEIPEINSQLSTIAQPNPLIWNLLTDWKDRKRSSLEIIEKLRPKLREIPGINAYASPGKTLLSGGGRTEESIQFVLQTTKSQSELDAASEILEHALRQERIIPFLNTDRGEDTQEYIVQINRDKAGLLGVDVSTIGETFDTFISGRRVTDFKKDSEQFEVIASVVGEEKRSPNDLSNMFVKGRFRDREVMVPLSNVVTLKKESIPIQINHYNQLRSVTLSGELAPGVSLGRAVETFERLAAEILPEGIRAEFSGETKQFLEARYTIYLIFSLALIFIFLVMAAQFESFVDPFIIMFTVPLSLSGALITLKLTGGSINIYSQIGLITLIGLITKHGILIVEFANQIMDRDKKIGLVEAVTQAALLRLRPILMTTAAMVLGAIPLVIATGAGAESRRQIGWVIAGGMMIGTLFTLFVIPAVYTYLSSRRTK
ncbi:MAG: efflux RND transporter permease subunit [Alphaproteobacteria bacterium]